MAADGSGSPAQDGGGFERAPAELTQRPAPLEGDAKIAAEKARQEGEMRRLNAEARGAAAADALLNPPLPEETPAGKQASGNIMQGVEERLNEMPQAAPAAEAQVLAEAMNPQHPDQEGTGRELIPAGEADQGKQQEGAPAEEEQIQEETSTAGLEETSAREYLNAKSGGRFDQFTPEQQRVLVDELIAAKNRMPNGDSATFDDVVNFVGQERAESQAEQVGPSVPGPSHESAEQEPEPMPPVAPVAPEPAPEAAPVSEVVPSAETPAEAVPAKTETAASAEKGAKMTPPAPEAAPALSEAEKLKQEIDAALQGDKEYLASKQALEESDTNKRWRDIDAMPEDQRDAAIDDLKGDKKAYEKYVEQREQVRMTEKHAEWNAREKQLHDLEEEIKKLPNTAERTTKEGQLRSGRKALEEDRRKTESASLLARDTHYQNLKRKYRKAENKLVELYMGPDKRGDKRTKEQAEEMVRDLAGKKWGDLSEAEREAFGGSESLFNKSYSFDRSVMNGSESYAKSKTDLDRIQKGVNPDGSKIPPDQIAARTQEYYESRITDKRQGPGRIRKGFKRFARGIDKYFGRAEMNDHGKKALGHAKSLISDYGWKGLVAQWLLPKEKRETAKNLRKLMRKEMGAYLGRFALRKIPQFIGLSLLFWLVLPVVIGKGLELTKPFGGNG